MAGNPDAAFCRLLLRSILKELRSARPDIRISAASLDVWRARDRHRRRWMVFRFGSFQHDGSFTDAFEARAAGWLAWMQREEAG